MQMKYLFFSLLLLLGSYTFSCAQPYYNQRENFLKANSVWAFGFGAGLDFNSGTAVPIHTKIVGNEGSTSVADPVTGRLLFYSNGGRVWNASHQLMPNGDSLLGNWSKTGPANPDKGSLYSTIQGVCIVPVIGTSDQYYLFSLSGSPKPSNLWGRNEPAGSLFYNVVDMSLDSGRGDIPADKKNIALNRGDTLSECMIAIPGNNCDVWLLVYKSWVIEEYMAYHITKEGIDTIPVTSPSLPPLITNRLRPDIARARTALAVSPDRSKIAMANDVMPYATMIGEFDPNTGQVNNLIPISNNVADTNNVVIGYSVCFSPDGSKLYIGGSDLARYEMMKTIPNEVLKKSPSIYQYDLNIYTSSAISNSLQYVGFIPLSKPSSEPKTEGTPFGMMTLYNDTIYLVKLVPVTGDNYIHRINQPNLPGIACDFQENAIPLLQGDYNTFSLHNNVVFPLYDTVGSLTLDTTICPKELVLQPINNYDHSYTWNDGDTATSKVINQAGTYWVTQSDGCYTYVDTFIIKTFDFPEPVISINVLELGLAGSYSYISYQWLLNGEIIQGAAQSTYTVSENGDYQVIVSNEAGCTDTSDVYAVTNVDKNVINESGVLREQIKIYPNPTTDVVYIKAPVKVTMQITDIAGRIICKGKAGAQSLSLKSLVRGIYLLRITDSNGCLIKTEKVVKK